MLLTNLRLGVAAAALALFVYVGIEANQFDGIGRWFPLVAAAMGGLFAFMNFVFELWRNVRFRREMASAHSRGESPSTVEPITMSGPAMDTPAPATPAEFLASARWFLIVLTLPISMYVAGAVFGAAAWVAVFMTVVVGRSVRFAVISALVVVGFMLAYSHYLNLRLPGAFFLE